MTRISVVICTRNRAESLRRVLASAAAMSVPGTLAWEMLVVDNGSTDSTQLVIAEFASRLPLRTVIEPKAGLSNARNRGVAEARGDYICWTDDDVALGKNWLAAYASAFDRYPEADYFGGPIELVLEAQELPRWFLENRAMLGNMLAERQLGDEELELSPSGDRMPYGASFAVRIGPQRAHLYDPELGVSPVQRRLGEEATILLALWKGGSTGRWVPTAKLKHFIPAGRLSLEYFCGYQKSAGETWAYLNANNLPNPMDWPIEKPKFTLFGIPSYVLKRMLISYTCYLRARLGGKSTEWMPPLLRFNFYQGAASYSLK
jgi:Glycosyl transferase family 2